MGIKFPFVQYRRAIHWTLCAKVPDAAGAANWVLLHDYHGSPLRDLEVECHLSDSADPPCTEWNRAY